MKEKAIWLAVGVVVGIVFAPQISKIPGLSRIPQV
jgi:hypothetical protein